MLPCARFPTPCQHPLLFRAHQELKGMKEGEDPEDGEAKEEGVTFNLWKKTEQPPPAEPVFDEVMHLPHLGTRFVKRQERRLKARGVL